MILVPRALRAPLAACALVASAVLGLGCSSALHATRSTPHGVGDVLRPSSATTSKCLGDPRACLDHG